MLAILYFLTCVVVACVYSLSDKSSLAVTLRSGQLFLLLVILQERSLKSSAFRSIGRKTPLFPF